MKKEQTRDMDVEELRRLATVVSDSNDAVIMHDLDGKILAWNRGAKETYGYTEDEALGKNVREIVAEADREAAVNLIQKIKKGDIVKSFELRRVTKDGRILDVWLTTTLLTDEKGKPVAIATTERDITERKQAEEMLKNSEENYRNIFENAIEGIFQSTPDGRYISINPAFAGIAGFGSPQDMINITDNIQKLYVHSEDRTKLIELFNDRDFVNNHEVAIRRKDGAIIWISMNVRAVKDESGNITLLEGTITDITERKEAEDELQKKNLELAAAYEELRNKQNMVIQQEKMASIGMLAAGITHELKNPLSIVMQGVDYLQTTGMDDAVMIEVIERMNKALLRADIIVKGLLSYSRQNPLSLTKQDILVLIDESLVLIEHELRKKNLQVVRQYAPDLPQVAVDGNQIKQVFVNVLLNGSDAMSPKGTFTISVRQTENEAGKNALQISFKDTGHGIPADKIKNIFDPFYTTKVVGNTGLGLYISKGIIERHGGVIYAESEIGQGANMIIELPIPV
jgi:two-component system, cell cycle sensor histidine kinase and response regulator CckA